MRISSICMMGNTRTENNLNQNKFPLNSMSLSKDNFSLNFGSSAARFTKSLTTIDNMTAKQLLEYAKTIHNLSDSELRESCNLGRATLSGIFGVGRGNAKQRYGRVKLAIEQVKEHISELENELEGLKRYPATNTSKIKKIKKELTDLEKKGETGVYYEEVGNGPNSGAP